MELFPFGSPNASPAATRTAGAICAITLVSGSSSASHTASISERMVIAPVGQTTLHCPQPTHIVSPRPLLNAGITVASVPRNAIPSASTP